MSDNQKHFSNLSIKTIRTLIMDGVANAQSGHLGMPLGSTPMAYVLWKKFLNVNPEHPEWFNRDRFVLSAGHGSMLLYSLLHLTGYDVSIEDLKHFRKLNSKTPGHPEYGLTPGVDVSTGQLGQGFAVGVGMAIAERYLAEHFNRKGFDIINHYTYVVCGDGDLMEGISYEASSLAGHLKLNKLIVLYDSNHSSLDAELDQSFSDDIQKRFESMHWQYILVEDGNDLNSIENAIEKARMEKEKPSIIEVKNIIGYGLPSVQGTNKAHSYSVNNDEIYRAKKFYNWDYFDKTFYVPKEVYEDLSVVKENGKQKEEEWNQLFSDYKKIYPQLASELERIVNKMEPKDIENCLPNFPNGKKISTRVASSECLNTLSKKMPELIGGSADLSSSTKAFLNNSPIFNRENSYKGKNIYFGVREFSMAAIANGMALHHLRPFVSTYFVFSDYMKPAIRMAALMKLPVTYIFTHDSMAVGQDGPTHQPVEQLASFRAMPNISVIRPADAHETKEAWKVAIQQKDKPTILVLSRQNLPTLEETSTFAKEGVKKGAYIVSRSKFNPIGILIASGSELQLALKAKAILETEGIYVNVVSFPSWDLFEKQSKEYKNKILPPQLNKRLVIEMGSKIGWREYAGCNGDIVSINSFGVSGPGNEVMEYFGIHQDNIVNRFKSLLK